VTTSAIPPIPFDALEPGLREALRPRYERLGYLGGFFQLMGHQPVALEAFDAFTRAAAAGVPERLSDLVALTVSCKLGNAYERNQHERLAVRRGFGRDWVAEVEALDPEGRLSSPDERATQRWVLAVLGDSGHGADAVTEELVDQLTVPVAVAAMLLAARYIGHAHVANALGLEPPVPSIFEDGFDG
jgi:alkylhydroperoxidase family enzyme